MRPARINVNANVTMAIVKTHEVWARVQPNSFSRGSTKTLQAYKEPSARFIDIPPITTRQRFMTRLSATDAYCSAFRWPPLYRKSVNPRCSGTTRHNFGENFRRTHGERPPACGGCN